MTVAGPPDSDSLAELQQLTDIVEINRQLQLLVVEEQQTEARLDEIVKGGAQLDEHLRTLDALRPQIGFLRNDGTALLRVLSDTSKLAERISGKVRQLDLEQSRVKATMVLVEDIQELKKCAAGVQKALAIPDPELAGHFISRYLAYDPETIARIFTPYSDDEYADTTPLDTLRTAQQQLTDLAMDGFDNAVQIADEEAILRYFKIFPMVGRHEVGLDKFSAYISGSISRQCQDNMRGNAEQPQFYASLLTRLFETIAMVVDRQEGMVNAVYGPGRMLRVIQRLQREADIQGSIILNGFSERRQLKRKLADISRYEESLRKRPGSASTAAAATATPAQNDFYLEPREVDPILSELATISQKSQIFHRFLHVRAEVQSASLREQPLTGSDWSTSLDGEGDGLVTSSKLDELGQGLMSDYVSMEEYFVRRSVEKAMSLDSHTPEDVTSSCVEDVFYILKTCTRRALSTSDANAISAIINGIGHILELDYVNVIQKRLGAAFAGVEGKGGPSYTIMLNNIDVSCTYIVKLTQELDDQVAQLFPPSSNRDLSLEKIRSCLAVLSEYADSFRNVLKTWIDNIFKQQMKPRVRPLLQTSYHDVRYILTEEEYAVQDAEGLFVKRFVAGLQKHIGAYRAQYSDWNYGHAMALLCDWIGKEWERYLVQTFKFNQLGALRFDKDLRQVTQYLTSTTTWPVRDRFQRLAQVATVLTLDSVSDLMELWTGGEAGGGGIAWRINAKDVKRVLALRTDLDPDAIAALQL
ncbi:Golgi transport complex subunit 4 [Geranomyces variabilis]|nr:Golgi transport complex subunit 4 [Geranomyces variabilis]